MLNTRCHREMPIPSPSVEVYGGNPSLSTPLGATGARHRNMLGIWIWGYMTNRMVMSHRCNTQFHVIKGTQTNKEDFSIHKINIINNSHCSEATGKQIFPCNDGEGIKCSLEDNSAVFVKKHLFFHSVLSFLIIHPGEIVTHVHKTTYIEIVFMIMKL